jgi:hypothetical protein
VIETNSLGTSHTMRTQPTGLFGHSTHVPDEQPQNQSGLEFNPRPDRIGRRMIEVDMQSDTVAAKPRPIVNSLPERGTGFIGASLGIRPSVTIRRQSTASR